MIGKYFLNRKQMSRKALINSSALKLKMSFNLKTTHRSGERQAKGRQRYL